MALQLKRILLTGGAGFIGSHVAEALLRRGVELTIVDNLDRFYSPARKKSNLEEIQRTGKYRFFNQDIRIASGMRELIARAQPEAVIHLAAFHFDPKEEGQRWSQMRRFRDRRQRLFRSEFWDPDTDPTEQGGRLRP